MEYTEVLDKQITRKQHYVPKAYLKNFSVSNRKSEQVYVVFANDENAKMVSIDNICCRSYLYDQIAIDPDSKTHVFAAPNEIENSFIELEGEYATIISKIKNALRDSDEFELARVEIDKLRQFMSSLLFRNPVFVHLSNYIIETKKPEKSRQKAAGCRNTQEVIYTQPLFITPFYLLKGYRSDRLDINIPVIPKAARRDGFTR